MINTTLTHVWEKNIQANNCTHLQGFRNTLGAAAYFDPLCKMPGIINSYSHFQETFSTFTKFIKTKMIQVLKIYHIKQESKPE